MKARKLPSGNWRCEAYIGRTPEGKKITKSFTAATKKEAEFLASSFLREHTQSDTDCTVAVAIERYIVNKTPVLSPSTINGYRILQRNAYNEINNFKVSKLTPDIIQRYISNYSITHSPKTTHNAYLLLRSATGIKFDVTMPTREVITYNIPSDSLIQTILGEARELLRRAVILAAVGSLRRGEICAVYYGDISGNLLHVHRDMVLTPEKTYIIKNIPKNASSDRYIALSDTVIAQLGTGAPDERIVPLKPSELSGRWNRLKKKLALPCRFHDLRHYSASVMHSIGIPDQYIMERGGWASDAVLKSTYRNTMDEMQRHFSQKANDRFDTLF